MQIKGKKMADKQQPENNHPVMVNKAYKISRKLVIAAFCSNCKYTANDEMRPGISVITRKCTAPSCPLCIFGQNRLIDSS